MSFPGGSLWQWFGDTYVQQPHGCCMTLLAAAHILLDYVLERVLCERDRNVERQMQRTVSITDGLSCQASGVWPVPDSCCAV